MAEIVSGEVLVTGDVYCPSEPPGVEITEVV